ncbi:MAG: ACT domain-containing protein [Planctomycetota bacterium]|jgi:hypothetical protein|nr:ACT domain-containing protein [Planctomycetota bacterium]
MEIKQIAIFMENKPGHLRTICRALADAGISIHTLSLADTSQYGILRLLTNEWEKARDVLTQSGFVVNLTEVAAVEVADRPGGLSALLDVVGKAGVNIEYMYAYTRRLGDKAVMILRFDDPAKAAAALRAGNVKTLAAADIFRS